MSPSIRKVIALALLMTASVNAVPTSAHALVGAFTGGATLIAGAALLGGSTAVFTACTANEELCDVGEMGGFGVFILDMSAMTVGLILLDSGAEQGVTFKALSPAEASALTLSDAELDAYNDQIEEINSVARSISSELASLPTASSQDAKAAWGKYGEALDPAALSAVEKIAAAAVSR